MNPPAFPIAPKEYDAVYINQLLRILTQYLNQESVSEGVVQRESGVTEVLTWLGGG